MYATVHPFRKLEIALIWTVRMVDVLPTKIKLETKCFFPGKGTGLALSRFETRVGLSLPRRRCRSTIL